MSNELRFIFKTEDVRRLVEGVSEYVVVRSFLESVVLKDGSKAGAVRVYADAVPKGEVLPKAEVTRTVTIEGCPDPPCGTGTS